MLRRNETQRKNGTIPEGKIDYRQYKPQKWEIFFWSVQCLAVLGLFDFLFYRLWGLLLVWPFLCPFYVRWQKDRAVQKKKTELYHQFRELLSTMQFAVFAGYSLENAIRESYAELQLGLGEEAVIVQELRAMKSQLALSIPAEELFSDLGERSGLEDIQMFANVLQISKRTGGNMETVLKNTWQIMSGKIDTEREISSTLAARKYEQNLMNLIPLGIILYIQLSFPEFMNVLYGNLTGMLVMTGCLAIYVTAWQLGERLMRIEV